MDTIKALLKIYEDASGQIVNYNKTNICFSKGVPVDRRALITSRLGV